MIVYADTGKASVEHLEFNFSMIEVLSQLGPVVAALGHVQSKMVAQTYDSVNVLPLDILVDPPGKLGFFRKLFFEACAVMRVLRFAKSHSAPVLFGYVFPMAQWLVHLGAAWFGVKAALVIHGDLGSLSKKGWRSWLGSKPWVKLNIFLARFGWVHCFVLEKRITDNLAAIGVKMDWFDHPYRFLDGIADDPLASNHVAKPLRLVFAGTLSPQRGAGQLVQLSSILKSHLAAGDIEIRHVGSARGVSDADWAQLTENGVRFSSNTNLGFLSAEEYAAGLRSADFLLILIDPDIYRFICSAVILDSLKFGVPFIAVASPVTLPLVAGGLQPGILCNDIPDLAAAIVRLAKASHGRSIYSADLNSLRARHSLPRVADQLRERFFDRTV